MVDDETDVSATLYPSHLEATSDKFAVLVVDGAAANIGICAGI